MSTSTDRIRAFTPENAGQSITGGVSVSSLSKRARPSSPSSDTGKFVETRKRHKRMETDLAVWDKSDEEIIAMASRSWTAECYAHYDISLRRVRKPKGEPHYLVFIFKCKYNEKSHNPQGRKREQTGQGTSNLRNRAAECDKRRGVRESTTKPTAYQQTLPQAFSPYSTLEHRTLIALQCAVNNQPTSVVEDKFYKLHVEMLRPGTAIPDPITVSRDIMVIYEKSAKLVKEYFQNRGTARVHLAIDGLTSSFAISFPGIIVIWEQDGKVLKAILECVKLTQNDDSKYLASKIADCLKHFGLENQLLGVCMDTTSNCDELAIELQNVIPNFMGKASRIRCIPHLISMTVKAFVSIFFYRPNKTRERGIKASRIVERQDGRIVTRDLPEEAPVSRGDCELSSYSDPDTAIAAVLVAEEAENRFQEGIDPVLAAHDEEVVQDAVKEAKEWAEENNVTFTAQEEKEALALFPKAAGLAKRIHESGGELQDSWKSIVAKIDDLEGDKTELTRHVATRWNTYYECLDSHLHSRKAIDQVIDEFVELEAYKFTEEQWVLADDLRDVLMVFLDFAELFSKQEVPLVYEVVQMLEELKHKMLGIRDQQVLCGTVPPLIRIAAQAALNVIETYYNLSDYCEIYCIAMILCPDKKLHWFKDHQWAETDIDAARQSITTRFNSYYREYTSTVELPQSVRTQSSSSSVGNSRKKSKFFDSQSLTPDSIEAYLANPIVPADFIKSLGGYLEYWKKREKDLPRLSRMALDFLSAPASSVEAEHSFSGAKLQANHLPHDMHDDTFRAQIALGSWVGTFLPEADVVDTMTKMLRDHETDNAKMLEKREL